MSVCWPKCAADVCFEHSPALRYLPHLVPADGEPRTAGKVDPEWALILWNCWPATRDVRVLFHPGEFIELLARPEAHPARREAEYLSDLFDCTGGNVWRHWMTPELEAVPGFRGCLTPKGQWSIFCDIGFVNEAEGERARLEIARITGSDWVLDSSLPMPIAPPLAPPAPFATGEMVPEFRIPDRPPFRSVLIPQRQPLLENNR